jgi:hypothetical protein
MYDTELYLTFLFLDKWIFFATKWDASNVSVHKRSFNLRMGHDEFCILECYSVWFL